MVLSLCHFAIGYFLSVKGGASRTRDLKRVGQEFADLTLEALAFEGLALECLALEGNRLARLPCK